MQRGAVGDIQSAEDEPLACGVQVTSAGSGRQRCDVALVHGLR